MAIEAGQLIAGHYRVVEHIGSGAMGVVWRAVDERLDRSVAVKKIVAGHALSEADRAERDLRAKREAKNAARLQHANAIVVFDITEHEGDPCLVMEYLPSRSLSQLLSERGTLDVAEVARIGEQVASALVAAHKAGLVHRDVKPGNILIDENGVAKLTDFGISRAQGDATLTQTGLVGGTPAYIAPELARGGDPTPASDVFALGATLYHAIEGQSPYGSNPNQLALLHSAASGKVNPPGSAGPATALLMSMLREDAGERVTMRHAAERLTAVASGGGAPAPPPPVLPAAPPERRSPPWQRTKSEPAASPNPTLVASAQDDPGSGLQHTAAFGAVPPPPPHAATPEGGGHRPTVASSRQPEGKKSKAGLFAGLAAFVVLIGIAAVLLLNDTGEPSGAAAPPETSETTTSETTSEENTTTTGTTSADDPIDWGNAGQLVVDYYSFPDGADASWGMLTPDAQKKFGGKDKFVKFWDKRGSTYAQDARASENGDGSVTITATVVSEEKGSKEKKVRVVRGDDGQLLIDSDTR